MPFLTNNTDKWIRKHYIIQIWFWLLNWTEQRCRPQIPIWPHFSFLALLFLSPCDVAIPAFLPRHNSAQISIFDVSYPLKRKHYSTSARWLCHGNPYPVQPHPSQRRVHDRGQRAGCCEKGLSISIRYALKLQMSPTSTLRATQIRCSTSMRTASFARSFR